MYVLGILISKQSASVVQFSRLYVISHWVCWLVRVELLSKYECVIKRNIPWEYATQYLKE